MTTYYSQEAKYSLRIVKAMIYNFPKFHTQIRSHQKYEALWQYQVMQTNSLCIVKAYNFHVQGEKSPVILKSRGSIK